MTVDVSEFHAHIYFSQETLDEALKRTNTSILRRSFYRSTSEPLRPQHLNQNL